MNLLLLKAFRKSTWSAYKLSQEAGLSDTTITRWVAGQDIRISTAEAIAKALGVKLKVEYL